MVSWNHAIEFIVCLLDVRSRCVAALSRGALHFVSIYAAGKLFEANIFNLLQPTSVCARFVTISNLNSSKFWIHQLALSALGSPAIDNDTGFVLIDTILMTAMIDRKSLGAIFNSTTSHRIFLSRCVSSKQMCALLEWLLDGDLDCARKIVFCDAIFYEHTLIGSMVPAASLRVLCRLLFKAMPMYIIDLNQPEALSHIFSQQSWSGASTLLSGLAKKSISSVDSLNTTTARILQITKRLRCMPRGFTSRYLWQTWTPGFLAVLLSTAWSTENVIPMLMSIQNVFAIGLTSALDFYACTPVKQVISWVIVGASLNCEKFVLEYAALFYQDMLWLTSYSTIMITKGNQLPKVVPTVACEFSKNKANCYYSRSCCVIAHLLRFDLNSNYVFPNRGNVACQNFVNMKHNIMWPHLIADILEIVARETQHGVRIKIFQRMLTITLVIKQGLFSRFRSIMEPRTCDAYRALTCQHVAIRGVEALLKTACRNRSPSMIRRLRRNRILTMASICSAYLPINFFFKSNYSYLMHGILLSTSTHSLFFLFESSLVFSALYELIVRNQNNDQSPLHNSVLCIGTTNHSIFALEKWILSDSLASKDKRIRKSRIISLRAITFLSQILKRRCCQSTPLLLLGVRSLFRFVKLTTTQPDFIREQSIVGLTQLCKKRLAESLFKIYAPTIIIDVVAMNLVNTFSHKFNDLLIPCIQCLVANNGDSKLSLCFFEDELGFLER